MKTQIRLIALLAVLCLIFCGCAKEDQVVTVQELTITVPGDYIDCSMEDYAASYTMVYGSKTGAVMALKELRSTFAEYGMENMSVMDYAELLKEGYQLDTALVESNGMLSFTFENQGNTYLAVTNIGNRPTVGGHRVTVEPWLLDFTGDLYGKKIQVQLVRYLREEKKFPDIEALTQAIGKDIENARKAYKEVKNNG